MKFKWHSIDEFPEAELTEEYNNSKFGHRPSFEFVVMEIIGNSSILYFVEFRPDETEYKFWLIGANYDHILKEFISYWGYLDDLKSDLGIPAMLSLKAE